MLKSPAVVSAKMTLPVLPIDNMADRHHGLTPEVAGSFHEAARVCLDRHYSPPVVFEIEDEGGSLSVSMEWVPTAQRSKDAWANRDDATRDGGYLCVLAATEIRNGLVALRRVQVGRGADYYIAPTGSDGSDLEHALRLEVSGVDAGDRSAVSRRLTAKVEQVSSVDDFPAMAGVIGFAAGLILLRTVEEEAA
jgi:hypothetical protein